MAISPAALALTLGLPAPSIEGGRCYPAAVFADSPVAYWRMGEASGAIQDATGRGNNSTATGGTPTYGVGGALSDDPDTAIALDGSTEYFTVPDGTDMDLGNGPATWEFWIKRGAVGAVHIVLGKGANSFAIGFEAGNLIILNQNGGGRIVTSTTGITDTTTWHHVVITKSGATSAIYLDGADVTGSITDKTLANTSSALYIGSDAGASFKTNGSLDEIALYKSALSSTRVAAHYAARSCGRVSPAALALTAALVAPSRVDQTVSPGALAFSLGAPAPSVSVNVNPGALALATAAVAPTISPGNVNVSPSALALASAAVAPTRIDQTAPIGTLALTLAPQAPAVGLSVSPATLAQALGVVSPAVFVAQSVAPDALAFSLSPVAPRIDERVDPGTIGLTLAVLSPSSIDAIASVSPAAIALASVAVAPTRIDQVVSPAALARVLALLAPSVQGVGQNVTPGAIALTRAMPAITNIVAGLVVFPPTLFIGDRAKGSMVFINAENGEVYLYLGSVFIAPAS